MSILISIFINNYFSILSLGLLLLFFGCSTSEDNPPVSTPPQGDIIDSYNIPVVDNDGWLVNDLGISDSKKTLLLNGIDKIRRGAYGEIHSLLIVHDKKLVLEKYYSGRNSNGQFINFDRFTKHEVQSSSKSFRSALMGIAIDKGFIDDVDSKLFSFFPELQHLRTPQKDKITLDHMLTMSSGLEWDEWSYSFGDPRNSLSTLYAKPASQWVSHILGLPLKYEPGSTFAYNTGASISLNTIIINSIPINYESFLRTYYTDLIESKDLPGLGYPLGASTTPRDMAKLGYIFLYDGKWKDIQVLSPEWIEKSITKRFQVNSTLGYGYQWWTRTLRTASTNYDVFYANGNGGQFVIIIKDLDIVIVSTGGKFGTAGDEIFNLIVQHVLPAFEN